MAQRQKSSNAIICRICQNNCISNDLEYIIPCSCNKPVCLRCLRREVELKNRFRCITCSDEFKFTPDINIIVKPARIVDDIDIYENIPSFQETYTKKKQVNNEEKCSCSGCIIV